MPTYEYRCPKGHDFERFYKTISASAPEVECPECGAMAARQLSGGAGLMFKGSGFYLTDYGKNAHRSSGAEGEKAKPKAESPEPGAGSPKAESPKPKAGSPKAEAPKSDKPASKPKPTKSE